MLKRFLAASAIATGIAGLLAGGNAFADLPEVNSGSYAPGQTIYAVATNSKICINKNGGYDGGLIIADIWGTNFRKQITFDSFSGDESCKLVGGAPSDGRMRFVTPMGLSNMSFFTQVEDGYVDGEIYLNLNNATTSNKYVRSYGNTTTRTAKSVATITLDANGGTGALPVIAGATIGSSVTLPKSTLVRDGYRFAGWNTKADGTGTSYADEATITIEEPGQIQLFAQWVVATTTLDTGRNVNVAIKTLAAGSGANYGGSDTLIKKLEFVDTLPGTIDDNTPKVNIALSGEEPVYAYWVADEEKIYINTEADTIYANSDSSGMFFRMKALASLTLPELFNTANVTNMSDMFYEMPALTSLTLSESFNTANVTDMSSMFNGGMQALTSLTLPESFNTANVTDMRGMFSGMRALTSLNLPASFNTANVTSMIGMFSDMRALTSLTLPTSFNTTNVTDMSNMFSGMSALTSLNLPTSFNTANVTNMSQMFVWTSALTSLTLPTSFNTANVTNMGGMFENMQALTSLTLPTSFDTANVTNMVFMFSNMSALASLTLPDTFVVNSGTTTTAIFASVKNTAKLCATDSTIRSLWPGIYCGTTKLQSGQSVNAAIKTLAAGSNVSYVSVDTLIKKLEFVDTLPATIGDNTPKVNIALSGEEPVYAYWVANEEEIYINTEADIIYANSDSSDMFYSMSALTSLNLPTSFNTANATSMIGMFASMSALTSLNLPTSFNTANVTDMRAMFAQTPALTSLNLPTSFNTANVTDMYAMFAAMRALTSLNLPESFNTANVTDMSYMFASMPALASLTLPTSFNTANVTNMNGMFSGMTALASLTLPDTFVVNSGTTTADIFASVKNTAKLYATDSTIRSLWPGVLGN